MLTITGSRSDMAWMNGHMNFRNVLGSIAPVDPPTVEQTVACFGYSFKKWRVHRRFLISPSGGIKPWSAIRVHTSATTNGPTPKNSLKWRISVPMDPIGQPALFWMSYPTRRKSWALGADILFRFASFSSIWRVGGDGGARARGERRGSRWWLAKRESFHGCWRWATSSCAWASKST